MNNKIKELAEAAAKDFSDGYPVTLEYTDKFAEKFAEMLINESVRLIDLWTDSGRFATFGQRLEAHFKSND